MPVRIGRISASSSGWVPSFELHDVTLLDAQQRPALQLPRVLASISPQSLLAFELRFEQLLIEGAQLEIRRDAAGRVFVAGLDIGAGSADRATTPRCATGSSASTSSSSATAACTGPTSSATRRRWR